MKNWLSGWAGVLVGVLACAGVAYYWYVKNYGEAVEGEQ